MPPEFVIAGAPKAGTTWLYRNLGRSPGVFLTANKEPRYYSVEEGERLGFRGPGDDSWMGHFVRSRQGYERLYEGAAAGQLRGEASSDYLYRSAVAARRLREEAPGARLVFILRDPVQRAYSNWLHHVRDGREDLSFGAALAAESGRIESGRAWWWHYRQRGFYGRQLEPFLDRFPADQVLLLTHEELRRDPAGLLRRVGAFLEVEVGADDEVLAEARNQSHVPRSRTHRVARRVLRPNRVATALLPQAARTRLRHKVNRATLYRPAILSEDHRKLRRAYDADTRRLGENTGLDVSGWLG